VTRARTEVESFILEIIAEMVERYQLRAIVSEEVEKMKDQAKPAEEPVPEET